MDLLCSMTKGLRKVMWMWKSRCLSMGTYQDTEHVKFKYVDAMQIASVTYKGSYDQITRVNKAVAEWICENGYDFDGPSVCIYHVSPHDAKTPEDLVTEVCFPVKKKEV